MVSGTFSLDTRLVDSFSGDSSSDLFSLDNPDNAGFSLSATFNTDTFSRMVAGTSESSLRLTDTPALDEFSLSILDDLSQSVFVLFFENPVLVNGTELFGPGAGNLTDTLTNSPFGSQDLVFERPLGQLGFIRSVLADGTSVETSFVFSSITQVPAPPMVWLLCLGIAGLFGMQRLKGA